MILTVPEDIDLIRLAGQIDAEVLEAVCNIVAPGVTTWELDEFAEKAIRERGAIPTFKGYRNFPNSICVSVNEEVVHGIPSKNRVLKEGDIISLDLGATIRRKNNGEQEDFIGDTAVTIAVGKISSRLEKLLDDTQRALYAGCKACRAGATLDDVGGAIEDI